MKATKQVRLSNSAEIKARINEFIGKKINIVLENKMVFFGELKDVKENEIVLLNMRLQKMSYRFKDIAELYFDVIV
jgi:hypothetical protein